MHIEILAEDSSSTRLLSILMPRFIGPYGNPHTWRLHPYRGIGRLPKSPTGSPPSGSHRLLLDNLPKLLRGYGKTPGVDAVVIVVDSDQQDCVVLLQKLNRLTDSINPKPATLFRIAIEETEAWYFGDRPALKAAYPRVKYSVRDRYVQDTACGTWEMLADALHPGGSEAIGKRGWPLSGDIKHEWAQTIGPHMNPEQNQSPSFGKLRDGLRRLVGIRNDS